MAEKQEVAVGVIKAISERERVTFFKFQFLEKPFYKLLLTGFLIVGYSGFAQQNTSYTKRVLESSEIDFLFSYYEQDGQNAAVTGGEGTEELTDATSTIVLRMPMNEDDVLTVDVGISAYTSASSSNVNPLDGTNLNTSPFDASSGESRQDLLAYINPSYQHSSEDRNAIWSANAYFSNEYDYVSIGFGGGYTRLFNEINTELSINGKVFLDKWNAIYPIELRQGFFDDRITGRVDAFSPSSKKIHIDIDPSSINKVIRANVPIIADSGKALNAMIKAWGKTKAQDLSDWKARIDHWRQRNCIAYGASDSIMRPSHHGLFPLERVTESSNECDPISDIENNDRQPIKCADTG